MSPRAGRVEGRALAGAGCLLLGGTLIQWSATIVIPAFSVVSPAATSAWRFLLGALALLAVTRPRVWRWTRRQWLGVVVFGVTTAAMNQCFYQAIARIPLGGAVAIEFLGPFCVAVVGRRSARHVSLALLAAAGVYFLTRPGNGVHLSGALFAGASGLFWACYLFASRRVGGSTGGFGGLAVAMSVAAAVTLPFSMSSLSRVVADPTVLGRLAIVGVMAVALGFGFELEGLRRVRPAVAGVIVATDPAVAFVLGWLILGQHVRLADLVGVSCVIVASALVTLDSGVGVAELPQ